MTSHLLTLQLAPGQNIAVTLSDPAQVEVLALAAGRYAKTKAQEEILGRTYHIATERTPGLDYDDRLTIRTKLSTDTLYKYLGISAKEGGLRSTRKGNKYIVTEKACREFLGDPDNE